MIFNTEAEIHAYFAGRMEEADRWAWWKDGMKWTGVSTVRPFQDIYHELLSQEKTVVDYFQTYPPNPASVSEAELLLMEVCDQVDRALECLEDADAVLVRLVEEQFGLGSLFG